jgi:hypothetical protein
MGVALVLGQLFAEVIATITIAFFMGETDEFVAVGGFASESASVED